LCHVRPNPRSGETDRDVDAKLAGNSSRALQVVSGTLPDAFGIAIARVDGRAMALRLKSIVSSHAAWPVR
jgi:hypothetical protein